MLESSRKLIKRAAIEPIVDPLFHDEAHISPDGSIARGLTAALGTVSGSMLGGWSGYKLGQKHLKHGAEPFYFMDAVLGLLKRKAPVNKKNWPAAVGFALGNAILGQTGFMIGDEMFKYSPAEEKVRQLIQKIKGKETPLDRLGLGATAVGEFVSDMANGKASQLGRNTGNRILTQLNKLPGMDIDMIKEKAPAAEKVTNSELPPFAQ